MRKNTSITVTLSGALLCVFAISLGLACHGPETPPAEYPPLDPVPSTAIEAAPSTGNEANLAAPDASTPATTPPPPSAADAGTEEPTSPPSPAPAAAPAPEPPSPAQPGTTPSSSPQ